MYVIDAEFDGLDPTKIHCLCVQNVDSDKVQTTTDYDQMRSFFSRGYTLIGHNLMRFDIPAFERILGIEIKSSVYDTLALSWYLFPQRNKHGLESWGIDVGIQKPFISNWDDLSVEEYINRCSEDVRINMAVWKKMAIYLRKLYGTIEKAKPFLSYLQFKMKCAQLQEKSGWEVDIPFAKEKLSEMKEERSQKINELAYAMPSVPIEVSRNKPKRFLNKDGKVTKLGEAWLALLNKKGLPEDFEGEVIEITGYEQGNPSSVTQLKDWLTKLGWVPQTFKFVKNDKGEMREIPQINLGDGKGICPSIKELFPVEPRLELLEGLSVLGHRIPLLEGIINSAKNGRTKAQIQGLTNTLRFKHATVVNLPKVDRLYSDGIRGCLVSGKGKLLCGSDMSSLEDRIKQHFIFKHDPDYVNSMNQPDFDPHLIIAVMAGMMTQEEADEYKAGNKKNKPIRDKAKNGNYACQYGAGPPRLVLTCGIPLDQAKKLHKAYWQLNAAITKTADEQLVKEVDGQMWLFNPVSKFWYSLRTLKDRFSTLVQGTASYVFDEWVSIILARRPQLTAQFHDEIVLEIVEGNEEKCKELIENAVTELNQKLKLNRELSVGVDFGKRYSDIH